MKKGEFIGTSKRMVVEYFNRYIEKTDEIKEITIYDVSSIGFYEESGDYRILLVTPASNDFYYEVTYDKETDKIHSYAYKKVEKRNFERNKNRYFRGYKHYRAK